jgi:hypothetical protein
MAGCIVRFYLARIFVRTSHLLNICYRLRFFCYFQVSDILLQSSNSFPEAVSDVAENLKVRSVDKAVPILALVYSVSQIQSVLPAMSSELRVK